MDLTLRDATVVDLPRILDIVLSALPGDPFYCYLWANREEFPNDHRGYWLQRLQADIFNPSYSFVVAELGGERVGPIAFGIWERKGNDGMAGLRRGRREGGEAWNFYRTSFQNLLSTRPRPDAPPARLSACDATLSAVTQQFDVGWPSRFQLELICTHRDYQRRGAGSTILQWGLHEAGRDGVPATVAASPMGEKLYVKYGFEYIREWVVRAEDDDEEVRFQTMVYRSR
ncbi:MAG: hypothetical protein M1840_007050 [Geoglossum simile]|nr:MAG: hypothetical protein M1840_007050 [Geoglossum simile]